MIAVVPDTEMFPDNFGNPLGCPKVRRVSGGRCSTQEQSEQLGLLMPVKFARASGHRFGLQASQAFLFVSGQPPRNRTLCGSEPASHILNFFAGLEQLHSLPASVLQCRSRSFWSHNPKYSKIRSVVPLLI